MEDKLDEIRAQHGLVEYSEDDIEDSIDDQMLTETKKHIANLQITPHEE